MGTPKSMILDTVKDLIERGKITTAQGNVLMVQMEGVRLIVNTVPRDVRAALNAAVKAGELGHLKKDGHKPEAYFHKNALDRAKEERGRVERSILGASRTVLVHHRDL